MCLSMILPSHVLSPLFQKVLTLTSSNQILVCYTKFLWLWERMNANGIERRLDRLPLPKNSLYQTTKCVNPKLSIYTKPEPLRIQPKYMLCSNYTEGSIKPITWQIIQTINLSFHSFLESSLAITKSFECWTLFQLSISASIKTAMSLKIPGDNRFIFMCSGDQ